MRTIVGVVRAILDRLPRRRRRFWRYVSPRRRGAGLVLLALLAGGVYVYWHFTNGHRVRDEAVSYLRNLTGANVAIKSARFSLFGGIELDGVRVDLPVRPGKDPLFYAQKVVLRHYPWSLLSGRLKPTEILCLRPVITIEYDDRAGQWDAMSLVDLPHEGQAGAAWELPPIRLRQGRLRRVERDQAGQMRLAYEKPLSMTWIPQGQTYLVVFEDEAGSGRSIIEGSVVLDLAHGTLGGFATGKLPIEEVRKALPGKYSAWLERYGIAGEYVRVTRPTASGPGGGAVCVELSGLALKLPAAEGGLELTKVSGDLLLMEDQVRLVNLRGQAGQFGGAEFELSGCYRGYAADSPFQVDLRVARLKLPLSPDVTGPLAEAVKAVEGAVRADGTVGLQVSVERKADGTIGFHGACELKGLAATYKHFPYPVQDVTGTVEFDADRVTLKEVQARRGPCRMRVTGFAELRDQGVTDIQVTAEGFAFDQALKDALPEDFARFWRHPDPSGTANGQVHVHRQALGQDQKVDVLLSLDGKAAARYAGFPYPLRNLRGQVAITGDRVVFTDVTATDGAARCAINGEIVGPQTDQPAADLTIRADNLPIDQDLLGALDPAGRKAVESLHVSGLAERVEGRIRRQAGKDLQYDVTASLRDVKLAPEGFPYPAGEGRGSLRIGPGQIVIEQLDLRHGQVPIRLGGRIHAAGQKYGLDLEVAASGVPLDEELQAALPANVRDVWKQFAFQGQADLSLTFQRDTPDHPGASDYRLRIQALDMQARYECFPYPLRGIRGAIVATPGKVVLEDLTASWGDTRAALHGQIRTDEKTTEVELVLQAENVPIDKDLLAAMPKEIAPLTAELRPEGVCDFQARKFRLVRRAASPATTAPATTAPATTAPASMVASAASSQPAPGGQIVWDFDGSVRFRDATINLGLDPKTLTGRIDGTAGSSPDGMTLNAQLDLDSLSVEHRRLTDLHGRLIKGKGPVLRIDDFSAAAYGGKIAGMARIALRQPLDYSVRLTVEQLQLRELFNAGVQDPRKRINIEGKLAGEIQYEDSRGDRAGRRAAGRIEITDGKILKLPVMLDVLHVMSLAPPSDAAFTDAFLTYQLRGDSLIFEEIYLRAGGLSLVGSGAVNMKTQALRMNFLNGPRLPRMNAIDELLQGFAREIGSIQVTGTVQNPRTRLLTIGNLEEGVRMLLNPGEAGK